MAECIRIAILGIQHFSSAIGLNFREIKRIGLGSCTMTIDPLGASVRLILYGLTESNNSMSLQYIN